jgi:hypothetical protein
MTDKCAQIDRFGSHRRSKIDRDGNRFFVGLCRHVHEYLLTDFESNACYKLTTTGGPESRRPLASKDLLDSL